MAQNDDEAKAVLLPSAYSENDEKIEDTPVVTTLTASVLNNKKSDENIDNKKTATKEFARPNDDFYVSESEDDKKPKPAAKNEDKNTAVNKTLTGAVLAPKPTDSLNYLSESDDDKKLKVPTKKQNSDGIECYLFKFDFFKIIFGFKLKKKMTSRQRHRKM